MHSMRQVPVRQCQFYLQASIRRPGSEDFLGLALETVSRGFTRLQEDGVIAVDGRRVEILDAAELDRIAHHPEAPDARRRGTA